VQRPTPPSCGRGKTRSNERSACGKRTPGAEITRRTNLGSVRGEGVTAGKSAPKHCEGELITSYRRLINSEKRRERDARDKKTVPRKKNGREGSGWSKGRWRGKESRNPKCPSLTTREGGGGVQVHTKSGCKKKISTK